MIRYLILAIRFLLLFLHIILSLTLGTLSCLILPFSPRCFYITCKLLGPPGLKILGIDLEIRGEEILQSSRPCVFISNHQNNYDIYLGGTVCPFNTVTLGKKSLVLIPLFGWFYVLSGNILIDRNNKKRSKVSMGKVTQKIKGLGRSVWILPEGTRSRGRGLLPFKRGAFITAINAGVPIVPVVFSCYSKNNLDFGKIRSGKVICQVMDPVKTTQHSLETSHELTQNVYANFNKVYEEINLELFGSTQS